MPASAEAGARLRGFGRVWEGLGGFGANLKVNAIFLIAIYNRIAWATGTIDHYLSRFIPKLRYSAQFAGANLARYKLRLLKVSQALTLPVVTPVLAACSAGAA